MKYFFLRFLFLISFSFLTTTIYSDNYSYKVVVSELEVPWGFVFLEDNSILITSRKGEIIHFVNGKKTIDLPYLERREILLKIIKESKFAKVIPMSIVKNESGVLEVLENSINSGCEGLMLKMLHSPYKAGMRGSNWLKLKREYENE